MAQSFKQAFQAARSRLGAGKTFTWNGKSYSTDLSSESGSARPKPRPTAPVTSGRPKPSPATKSDRPAPRPDSTETFGINEAAAPKKNSRPRSRPDSVTRAAAQEDARELFEANRPPRKRPAAIQGDRRYRNLT